MRATVIRRARSPKVPNRFDHRGGWCVQDATVKACVVGVADEGSIE